MDDRTLLEKAARAAGRPDWDHAPHIVSDEGSDKPWWNSLADDGDAMRLAVDIRLRIEHGSRFVIVYFKGRNYQKEVIMEDYKADARAATRRAITRAAAAMADAGLVKEGKKE